MEATEQGKEKLLVMPAKESQGNRPRLPAMDEVCAPTDQPNPTVGGGRCIVCHPPKKCHQSPLLLGRFNRQHYPVYSPPSFPSHTYLCIIWLYNDHTWYYPVYPPFPSHIPFVFFWIYDDHTWYYWLKDQVMANCQIVSTPFIERWLQISILSIPALSILTTLRGWGRM